MSEIETEFISAEEMALLDAAVAKVETEYVSKDEFDMINAAMEAAEKLVHKVPTPAVPGKATVLLPSQHVTPQSVSDVKQPSSGPQCHHGSTCVRRKELEKGTLLEFFVCPKFFQPCKFRERASVDLSSGTVTDPVDAQMPAVSSGPVSVTMELVSMTTFVAHTSPFSQAVVEFYRSVESSHFDGNWTFAVAQHDQVVQGIKQFPGSSVKPIPPSILSILSRPAPNGDVQDRLSRAPEWLLQVLMPFQRLGVQFALERNGRALIGDEMGLGKTIQAIAVAACYEENWPLLIICPSSLRLTWNQELLRWVSRLSARDICVIMTGQDAISTEAVAVIISYDLAMRRATELSARNFQFVIADESHYIKNFAAKRTKCIVPILRKAQRALLLTGTPALNRPSELFTQISALRPDVFSNWNEYIRRYCNAHQGAFGLDYSGSSHPRELHCLLESTVMIRRLKRDVLQQLPAKRRAQVQVSIAKQSASKLRTAMAKLPPPGAHADRAETQAILTELYSVTAQAKLAGIQDYVRDMVETNVKFLVFGHHTFVLDAIQDTLTRAKACFIRIDGKTPQATRAGAVERFQDDPEVQVALLSIQAAGMGLTFTAASIVVFAELHWTPTLLIQAEDRVHRIGQQSSVNISYLLAKGSIDDIMWPCISRKLEVVSAAVNGCEEGMILTKAAGGPGADQPRLDSLMGQHDPQRDYVGLMADVSDGQGCATEGAVGGQGGATGGAIGGHRDLSDDDDFAPRNKRSRP